MELGAKWGAGERAAIMAGYGKISAYQGGRSAAVRASVQPVKAGGYTKSDKGVSGFAYIGANSYGVRLTSGRHARALINTIIDNLKMHVSDKHPNSPAAQTLRRLQGQPVRRVPGYCVCGDPVTEGYASCEPCRVKHRHFTDRLRRAAKRCTLPHTYPPIVTWR